MLLASTFDQSFGTFCLWTILLVYAGSFLAKKFAKAAPEVSDAARKAATQKALQLIARFFK